MKHVKLFEAFVNEAGQTVRGHKFKMKQNINFKAFQKDVDKLIDELSDELGRGYFSDTDVHAVLHQLWWSICHQTRRQDMGHYLEKRLAKRLITSPKDLKRSMAYGNTKLDDMIYDKAMSISKHVGKDKKCIGMAMCFSDVLGKYGVSEDECIRFVKQVGHQNYSTLYL